MFFLLVANTPVSRTSSLTLTPLCLFSSLLLISWSENYCGPVTGSTERRALPTARWGSHVRPLLPATPLHGPFWSWSAVVSLRRGSRASGRLLDRSLSIAHSGVLRVGTFPPQALPHWMQWGADPPGTSAVVNTCRGRKSLCVVSLLFVLLMRPSSAPRRHGLALQASS